MKKGTKREKMIVKSRNQLKVRQVRQVAKLGRALMIVKSRRKSKFKRKQRPINEGFLFLERLGNRAPQSKSSEKLYKNIF